MSLPLNSKITLINKYIQVNNMKNHGRAEHDGYLVKELLESINEDLREYHEPDQDAPIDLNQVIQELKTLRESQSNTEEKLSSVAADLQNFIENQANTPISLSALIQELEESVKNK